MIAALFIGLIVGAIAKIIMGGKEPKGFLITMIIGVVGSLLAHLIGSALGWYRPGQGPGFFASLLGAMLLIGIYDAVSGRKELTR